MGLYRYIYLLFVVVGVVIVMTMSAGQVGPLPQKLTSARCTQSESGRGKNRRLIAGRVVLAGRHTLTSKSQEVMLGLILAIS